MPADPAGAVAAWSRARLKVPPGHARAGEPMELPAYAVEFFREALAGGVREAGCFVGRKNAKSAAVAVLILAFLADDGPLRRKGWRAGVASINREKAIELWKQASDIALASGLLSGEGGRTLSFGKVPRVVRSIWGECEFLSADKSAGHASGFDLAIADELGLFPERGRDLVAGLLSSTSARDGRLLAISVIGASPLSKEMIARADDPATVVHVHEAPKGCRLDDPVAWRAANPTLGAIKSEGYMRDMARRALANPSEQPAFRAFDLNQPAAPGDEMLVPQDRWEAVAAERQPERAGPVYLGFDIGGTVSMTAAALYWPETARLECYGAFGDTPDLAARGEADGCGAAYLEMQRYGLLRTWPGRVTPCGPFLAWIGELLHGRRPALALADRYRQGEAEDALQAAGVSWPVEWRAQGSGKDGSEDIRQFQRAVESGRLRPGLNLLLEYALSNSRLRYDENGNPALDRRRQHGRIDPLSAAVLAVGAGERMGRAIEPILMVA
ncbi:MAG: hypothetical protein F4Y03_06735 [Alphaproteobacteria bacterium]|nr:hypothetical protein [Alphaproteobacteria bacterium]